jgi:antitoxin VapB
MAIATGRTFRCGDSEAVLLPNEMTFGESVELELIKSGDVLTICPKKARMTPKQLADALRKLPKPETIEKRQPIEWPKRGF